MDKDKKDGSDEREFLHDMATPLGTAMLLSESLLDDVQNRPDAPPDDLMRLIEIFKALEKMNQALKERRAILIARGVPSARS